MSDRSNKLATFIDGANLHATTKTLGFDIDYKRLLQEFRSRGTLVRAFYFTMLTEDQEFASIRPLIDWLDYNGYALVTKQAKAYTDSQGRHSVCPTPRLPSAIQEGAMGRLIVANRRGDQVLEWPDTDTAGFQRTGTGAIDGADDLAQLVGPRAQLTASFALW